jgi:hypothetical protein
MNADPPYLRGDGVIPRDPETGLATGFLEETDYAAIIVALFSQFLEIPADVEPIIFLTSGNLNVYLDVHNQQGAKK